jgi:CHAD domain-containing protein
MASKQARKPASAPTGPAEGSRRIEGAVREQQRLLATALSLEAPGAEDVHRSRVAARRLRSMLKTFGPLMESRRARLYRVDLRSFARALAGVREADVRRDLLAALADRDAGIPPPERARLDVVLEDARIAAREALRRHQVEPGWVALCRALERHAAGAALFQDRQADSGRVLQLAARSWRRPVQRLEDPPESTPELHELRLALKHCRYALEPVADLAPKATARLMRRLRSAQDCIGEHRDTLLAEHWVRSNERLLGRSLAARLVGDLGRQERLLRTRAVRRSRRVLPAWEDWRSATRRFRRESTADRP